MFIHISNPSETTKEISQKYNIAPDQILAVNQLTPEQPLISGESIVIPADQIIHTIRTGESHYNICCQYAINPDSLAEANKGINMYCLVPDMKLQIPLKNKYCRKAIVNGFIEPSKNDAIIHSLKNAADVLSYVSIFSYNANMDGTIQQPIDTDILNTARKLGISTLMVVTNLNKGAFDSRIAHHILTDMRVQDQLIKSIFQTLEEKKHCGIMIDFERVLPSDREYYNHFLLNLRNRLLPGNRVLSIAAPLCMPDPYRPGFRTAYDYNFMQSVADFIVILANDWGWAGSPPMPVMPLGEVEKNLLWLSSGVPKGKVVLNLPMYGFNWIVPKKITSGPGMAISHKHAIELARSAGTCIHYDINSQTPYYHYLDNANRIHIVWFEDPRSMSAKFDFINKQSLGGISLWSLGRSFPQLPSILKHYFQP